MAEEKRISALPAVPGGTTFDGTEIVVFNKSGVTYKGTLAALIANQIPTGGSDPVVQSAVSGGNVIPTFSVDMIKFTALGSALTISNPTGTAKDAWGLVFAFKDDGTQRALTWGTAYRAGTDVTLPANTTTGKWTYVNCIYNATDSKYDVLAVGVSG